MFEKRPKITIPKNFTDLWIDRFSFLLFFIIWLSVFVYYPDLPDEIPTHFNGRGQADAFGSKQSIWVLMGVFSSIFIGIYILNKYPHLHNYTVKITEENALKNYRFSTRVLRVVNFLNLLVLAYILKTMLTPYEKQSTAFGGWFLPTVMIGTLVLIIYIFVKANKINSKT
ncbi:MAG: DUF1648 domain-containing protein [Flavobacteriaceae bacterium]